jgi:hypothetical protein
MTTIKAKVNFDEASHLGAFRLHMWHRYQVWLMLRTFLSVALILAGIILLMSQGPNPMPVLMLMVGTFALLRPLIWKIMHGRNLRRLPGYGQSVLYTFTPDSMSINGEDRQGEVKWSTLFESVSTKKGLLLYHGKKSYTWVPSESFDSAEDILKVAEWSGAK